MAKTFRDNEVTERLRSWIQDHYSARGKFTKLEADSLVPAQRWKDLFYGRQFATKEMLDFVRTQSSRDFQWIKTGIYIPPEKGYPFLTAPPLPEECATLTSRLVWTIKEWTAPRGAALFSYLSEKANGQISADEWSKVVLGIASPSPEMIELVCIQKRHLTEWIATGTATSESQVDPSDQASISKWQKNREKLVPALAKLMRENLNGSQEN